MVMENFPIDTIIDVSGSNDEECFIDLLLLLLL